MWPGDNCAVLITALVPAVRKKLERSQKQVLRGVISGAGY